MHYMTHVLAGSHIDSERWVLTNSVDPDFIFWDQIDQGLHCLPFHQWILLTPNQ